MCLRVASWIQVLGVENLLDGRTESASRGSLGRSLLPTSSYACIYEKLVMNSFFSPQV